MRRAPARSGEPLPLVYKALFRLPEGYITENGIELAKKSDKPTLIKVNTITKVFGNSNFFFDFGFISAVKYR